MPSDLSKLWKLIEDTGADLVVLDSLRRLAPGIRESESDDMAPLVAELATIARELDVAIVLIPAARPRRGGHDAGWLVNRGSS